VNQEEQG
jgi:hypothetical protein